MSVVSGVSDASSVDGLSEGVDSSTVSWDGEGVGVGRRGVKGSSFGRNAELMSPIPTKKSSKMHIHEKAAW